MFDSKFVGLVSLSNGSTITPTNNDNVIWFMRRESVVKTKVRGRGEVTENTFSSSEMMRLRLLHKASENIGRVSDVRTSDDGCIHE